jgi:hypothetical protein
VIDDAIDESIPLAATELIGGASIPPTNVSPPLPSSSASPFEDVTDFYGGSHADLHEMLTEVPMASVEIPLPAGILDSLPQLDASSPIATATAPPPLVERRATDGLVKEVTIPLNLSLDEIRNHRRLRLKITVDVNLLP